VRLPPLAPLSNRLLPLGPRTRGLEVESCGRGVAQHHLRQEARAQVLAREQLDELGNGVPGHRLALARERRAVGGFGSAHARGLRATSTWPRRRPAPG